jgi:transposase-like protein
MESARNIERVACPTCNSRLFDKEDGTIGFTRVKCRVCKSTWRIDLKRNRFTLIARKAKPKK